MSSTKRLHNRQINLDYSNSASQSLSWTANYFIIVGVYTIWRTTFYNYALTDLFISPVEIAYLFTAASIPALFTFCIAKFAHIIKLDSLISFFLLVLAVGLLLAGNTSTIIGLYAAVMLISAGFNAYLPLINTVTIKNATYSNVNLKLGRLKSLGPLAAIAATFLLFWIDQDASTRDLLLVAGLIVLLVSLVYQRGNRFERDTPPTPGFHFKTRLWPIYLLNFLAGSRSALFKTFVVTQIVSQFHVSTVQLSGILLAGSIAGLIGYRTLGWLATTYNPKNVLTIVYFLVNLLFIGLIFADLSIFIGLFLLDSFLFGTAVITDASLKRADPEKFLIANLATGATFFHLAGVVTPLVLASVLQTWGQPAVMCFGAIIAMIACITARKLP